ncbi:hypothetical protein Pyn_14989 [Prunus yedoensis var. nudiflora]|uniref:Uncharacterized protein n=1 Tax=Prunus yedoensis var. nudiflora TaxID=2094558 RepID=A0A314XLJ0_PRUYE|nr:hypothetical protein Pyn_14989 [Prunus yedoensis var. nudiflora]
MQIRFSKEIKSPCNSKTLQFFVIQKLTWKTMAAEWAWVWNGIAASEGLQIQKGLGVGEERTLEGKDLEDLQASEKQELLELFSQELDKQGLDGGFDEDGSLLGDLLRAQICWKRIWTKNMNNIKSHWKTKDSSSA